jgi:hypothetical protein
VIPAEHVLRVVGLQEAVAAKVAEDPASDRVLETLQELIVEGGGFVEAEVGFWMGGTRIRVSLDLLEEPVHYAQMEMVVRIEAGAEAVEKTHGPQGCGLRGHGAGFFEGSRQGPEEDVKDGAGGLGSVMKVGAQALGNGQNPLAHRDMGKDVVHQMSRRLGHALGITGRAGSPSLTGKRHQEVIAAGCAACSGEPMSQDSTPQVAPELLFHVIRHAVAHGIGFVGQGEVGLQVFPNDAG